MARATRISSRLMFRLWLVMAACVIHVTSVCDDNGVKRDRAKDSLMDSRCGMCGEAINMTFVVQNQLVYPHFKYNTTVVHQPQRQMIYFLEKAAQQDPHFQFSSYYYSTLGYYMTAIAGLEQSQERQCYWMFSSEGKLLDKGLSSYVVSNEETILINYTYTGKDLLFSSEKMTLV